MAASRGLRVQGESSQQRHRSVTAALQALPQSCWCRAAPRETSLPWSTGVRRPWRSRAPIAAPLAKLGGHSIICRAASATLSGFMSSLSLSTVLTGRNLNRSARRPHAGQPTRQPLDAGVPRSARRSSQRVQNAEVSSRGVVEDLAAPHGSQARGGLWNEAALAGRQRPGQRCRRLRAGSVLIVVLLSAVLQVAVSLGVLKHF